MYSDVPLRHLVTSYVVMSCHVCVCMRTMNDRRAEDVEIITSRAPSLPSSTDIILSIIYMVQPAKSASVNIRTLHFCSYAHLWNISCCSEVQCMIGTSQKAWRSAWRFPLAAIVKSNISACAYLGQEC